MLKFSRPLGFALVLGCSAHSAGPRKDAGARRNPAHAEAAAADTDADSDRDASRRDEPHAMVEAGSPEAGPVATDAAVIAARRALLECYYAALPFSRPPMCDFCACSDSLTLAQNCNGDSACWPLVHCIGTHCNDLGSEDALSACLEQHCPGDPAARAAALALTSALGLSCRAMCFPTPTGADAGR